MSGAHGHKVTRENKKNKNSPRSVSACSSVTPRHTHTRRQAGRHTHTSGNIGTKCQTVSKDSTRLEPGEEGGQLEPVPTVHIFMPRNEGGGESVGEGFVVHG